MSVYLGTQLLSGIATNTILNAHDLFDFKWTDHTLADQSWLRADTFSWQEGTVYSDAYDHLAADLNGLTETKSFKRYDNEDDETDYIWVLMGDNSPYIDVGDYVYEITNDIATKTYQITAKTTTTITVNSKIYEAGIGRDSMVDAGIISDQQTETIGSYTITYVLADDGHKITTDETTVANIYAESGVAWYYVIDQANTRFKLPRTKYGFEGLRDSVGKYVEAGLPNITGELTTASGIEYGTGSGAIQETKGSGLTHTSNASNRTNGFTFDASRSSAIYGNSDTVQPPATQMYLYFYVGQFSQSATEQTAGITTSQLNAKLDLDLGNLDATGKKVLDGQWVLPSNSMVADEVSANGSTDLQFDVSSLLPNDGYDYDVLISCIATTGSTSGNYVPVYVYSDLNSGSGRYICICRPRTRASSSVFGGGSTTIPVGIGRKLYLIRSTNYNGTVSIDIRGYRRIGTNS